MTLELVHSEILAGLGDGLTLNLLEATPEDAAAFDPELIIRSLGRQVRWIGHGKRRPSTILRHSLNVGGLVEAICDYQNADQFTPVPKKDYQHTVTWGYMHDFHEAYMGDIQRPVARAIAILAGGGDPVYQLKKILDERIRERFRVDWDHVASSIIGHADDIICAWEGDKQRMNHLRWCFGSVEKVLEQYQFTPLAVPDPEGDAGDMLAAIQLHEEYTQGGS